MKTMRKGGLRVPNMMMSFGNGTTQRTYAFETVQTRLLRGPRQPIISTEKLDRNQRNEIKESIQLYRKTEQQQTVLVVALTIIVSCTLYMLLM
ncbi:hypothetical protein [Roseivirga misakiensis]|uniref:Uncharacterized protein n=1 Tax=Roseivirga misakiensis TaxID=1563681 RepID=A0A1E5SYR2_9BACT|nr:hypothetical protein [Roseivirga misakiensis]OEK04260.1 hypothetical protein BFP71_12310 [Roseivirga misakiensis]